MEQRIWWVHLDLNQGPAGYEPVALTAELWTHLRSLKLFCFSFSIASVFGTARHSFLDLQVATDSAIRELDVRSALNDPRATCRESNRRRRQECEPVRHESSCYFP